MLVKYISGKGGNGVLTGRGLEFSGILLAFLVQFPCGIKNESCSETDDGKQLLTPCGNRKEKMAHSGMKQVIGIRIDANRGHHKREGCGHDSREQCVAEDHCDRCQDIGQARPTEYWNE